MAVFGYDRDAVERRIGHPSQIGGLKPYTLTDGRANGIRAVDFRTTKGLEFTVLLDRGMDISEARYRGMSLCWRSPAGDVAPAFYDARGREWLRTFFGGLLSTCGLATAGASGEDDGEQLGIHGRIGASAAERVSLYEDWSMIPPERPELKVVGHLREASLFGEHLEMRRTITADGDGAWLEVRDQVVNIGARKSPCMLLYHINLGFPLLDDGAELVTPATKVIPRDGPARDGKEDYARMHGPVDGYAEKVYFHTLQPGSDGHVTCALVNRRIGLGLRLRFNTAELPCFTQWKMLGEREYTLGLEPANCLPLGRSAEREAGRLVELEVGERIEAGFEISVIEGADALDALAEEASGALAPVKW